MADWQFEYSVFTKADRSSVWDYWTSMKYHESEPGVERIELDGPFEEGTTGRTITKDTSHEWELTEVNERQRAVITGHTPDGGKLSFAWEFEDEEDGTRMKQRIEASGPFVKEYPDILQQMENNTPRAMRKLAKTLNRRARGHSKQE